MSDTKTPAPIEVVRNQLQKMQPQFEAALPKHMPVARFERVVMTAVQNNPDLIAADRQSLWNAAMRAAQDGLLPDGREGAIVIYNTKVSINGKDQWIKKAQWMPMVFGILKKVRNSNQVAMVTARVVYGGDNFRYWLDEQGEHILYEPCENPDKDVVRKVFAAARTKDGELLIEPLSPDDVEKIRSVSRAKNGGPWTDWWEEMAKKSAIRRLAKRLPMSSDLDDLVRRDDDLYDFGNKGGDPGGNGRKPPSSLGDALDRLAGGDAKLIEGSKDPTPKVDTIDAGTDDTPTNSDDDKLDIPETLRRTPASHTNWRQDTEGALAGCKTAEDLFQVRQKMMADKTKVSTVDWQAADAVYRQMFDAIAMA